MNEIHLRSCTKEDAENVVPLIYSSGPAAFDFVFKNTSHTAQEFLSYAFQKPGGEFSFDNHYALCNGTEILAVGAVFGKARASTFTLKDALNIIRFYKGKSISRALNGLKIETMIKLPKKNEFALAHLGVREELRGKGYGTKLIRELMATVPQNTSNYFILDVAEENPKAKALYERLGFKVTKKYISTYKNEYARVPNHFRMEYRPK